MKYKNLLVLLSIFAVESSVDSGSLFEKVMSPDASLGRIEVSFKDVFYDSFMLTAGVDSSLNFYCGVGYYSNFDLASWPIDFKFTIQCLDWANREFSSYYLQKWPVTLSFSSPIWGFNVGAYVSASLNKKFLAGVFLNIRASDYIDIDIFAHMKGSSDFFSKNIVDRNSIAKWIEENDFIAKNFKSYVEKVAQNNEVSESMIQDIIQQARDNVKFGKHLLGIIRLSKKEQARLEKAPSLFVMGNSGSGKTFMSQDLLKNFVKKERLKTIALITVNGNCFTPQGYVGGKADQEIVKELEKLIKAGLPIVSVVRGYIMVDEIDSISSAGKSNTEEFYSKVQKEMLDFVDGNKIYSTIYGNFKLSGALKLLPGAYAKSASDIENLSYLNVFETFKKAFLSNQVDGLKQYIKIGYEDIYTEDLYEDLNVLSQKCGKFSKNLYDVLMKNSVVQAIKNKDGREFMKVIKEHPIYLDWLSDTSLKCLAAEISDLSKKIKTTLCKSKEVDFKDSFDDFYVRYLTGLNNLKENLFDSNDIKTHFVHYVERAAEYDKRDRASNYIIHAGMGREIVRRSAKVYYLEDPSYIRSMRYLRQELNSFLKDNHVFFADFTTEDGYDQYYKTLLAFDGNLDARHAYNELSNKCKNEKEDFARISKEGKPIHLKKYDDRYHFCSLKQVNSSDLLKEIESELYSIESKIKEQKECLSTVAKSLSGQTASDSTYKKLNDFIGKVNFEGNGSVSQDSYKNLKIAIDADLSLCKNCEFIKNEFSKFCSREKSKDIIFDDWIKAIPNAERYFDEVEEPVNILNRLCRSKEIRFLESLSKEVDKLNNLVVFYDECKKIKKAFEDKVSSSKKSSKDFDKQLQELASKLEGIKSRNSEILVETDKKENKKFDFKTVFSLG